MSKEIMVKSLFRSREAESPRANCCRRLYFILGLTSFCLTLLSTAGAIAGPATDDASQVSNLPRDIAHELVAKGKIDKSAARGKAKHRFEKDEQRFALPFGESPAVLFELLDSPTS